MRLSMYLGQVTSIGSRRFRTICAVCSILTLFGVSPTQAAIITGESASATSAHPIRPASSAVDNLGITINTADLATDGQIVHSNLSPQMWLTDSTLGTALNVQLTINLGGLYNLDGMRIWNWNEAPDPGPISNTFPGVSLYDLETSSNNVDWVLRQDDQVLAEAPGTSNFVGVYFGSLNWPGVQYVRLTILDTYNPTDSPAGLSEIMFSGELVPEPSSAILLGVGIILLGAHRRRADDHSRANSARMISVGHRSPSTR